jgi:hypothetical protein
LNHPLDQKLYQAVDEVLHYIWDPIGICDEPKARDEYYSYSSHVFELLKNGASEKEIADYLYFSTTERMGLSANTERDLHVVNVLISYRIWRKSLQN